MLPLLGSVVLFVLLVLLYLGERTFEYGRRGRRALRASGARKRRGPR